MLFLLFSLFLAINLPGQTTWADGTKFLAQPAFLPYAAVITMTAFAVLHVISCLVSPALEGRWREVGFWLRSFEFAGWFMAYVAVVPRLGYLRARSCSPSCWHSASVTAHRKPSPRQHYSGWLS